MYPGYKLNICFVSSLPFDFHKREQKRETTKEPGKTVSTDGQTICDGGAVTLTANVSGGQGTSLFQWLYDDPIDGWQPIVGENLLRSDSEACRQFQSIAPIDRTDRLVAVVDSSGIGGIACEAFDQRVVLVPVQLALPVRK